MSSVSSANKRTFTQSISSTPQPDLADPNKRTKLPETLPLFGSSSSTDPVASGSVATSMDIDALNPANSNPQDPIPPLFYPTVNASDRLKATENLVQAFKANNEQGVKDALKAGADIDVTTVSGGETPLMMAIERGWLDMAKFLLEKSSSVTVNVSNQGQTALSLAFCKINDIAFLTNLFEQCTHKTINQIDKEGRTALMNAFGAISDVVFLTKLLERCTDETINQIDQEDGQTALMKACECVRDMVFLTKLLEPCTDETINQIDKEGQTALMLACQSETDIVFLTKLLDRCSDKTVNHIEEDEGKTALLDACQHVTDAVFLTKLLDRCSDETINQIDKDEGRTALMMAVGEATDPVFLNKLLGRCSLETINHIDNGGDTALMMAVGCVKDVGFLETLLGQTSDRALNTVCREFMIGQSVLIALVNAEANVDRAKHLVPLFLERLTWANLKSKVLLYPGPNELTAWQIVNQQGAPWADTAKRIGEAMVMSCAQYAIPRSPFVESFARSTKNLAAYTKEETRANICDELLQFGNLVPKPIPSNVLYIIRSYHENPFRDLSQAVSAINDFMTWHLTVQKKKCPTDGSHALENVLQVLAALHDSKSTLNQCLAEYEALCRKAAP